MPLFFILGGYFFKPNPQYKYFLAEQGKKLLIPYTIFLFVFIFFLNLNNLKDLDSIKNVIFRFFFGGGLLHSELGAFWFITCFFYATVL